VEPAIEPDLKIEFSDPPNLIMDSLQPTPVETFSPQTPPVSEPPMAAPMPVPQPSPAPVEAAFVPTPANASMAARMDAYFHAMAEMGSSDLHLSVSMPPMVRKDGKMRAMNGDSAINADTMRQLLTSIMPAKNQEEFAARHDTDFAYEIPGLARFRCNVFMDRKGMGAVFRIIPSKILTAEDLGLS
jgi:twitching motility protein PilT